MILATLALLSGASMAASTGVPAGIAGQLPPGYDVVAQGQVRAGKPMRRFVIVALVRKGETWRREDTKSAPARPLLVFEQRGGQFVAAGRNDHVVLKADEGGQCDPFLDGEAKIAVKGRYFTIENGVACGQHWTDYRTFRLDDAAGGFVFDNERQEAWELNPSNDPDAEALVQVAPARVTRDPAGHATLFGAWRPRR